MEQTARSRREFLKTTSMLGVAVALRIGDAFADSTSNTQNVNTTSQTNNNEAIRPFHFNFTESELNDLRRRVKATKWPQHEAVTDTTQGVQLTTMQKLAHYWGTDYDWRKGEAKLKAVPHFITEIDGLDIHFIHVRSKHENALPMIIAHGWPGSIVEQLKVVDPLTKLIEQ